MREDARTIVTIKSQYRVLSKHILCRVSPEQATEIHIIVPNYYCSSCT